jgi:hypothetical protein
MSICVPFCQGNICELEISSDCSGFDLIDVAIRQDAGKRSRKRAISSLMFII